MTDTTAVAEPVTEPVLTFEQELDALLTALPERTIGEYVKTEDVQDLLLDLRLLAQKHSVN